MRVLLCCALLLAAAAPCAVSWVSLSRCVVRVVACCLVLVCVPVCCAVSLAAVLRCVALRRSTWRCAVVPWVVLSRSVWWRCSLCRALGLCPLPWALVPSGAVCLCAMCFAVLLFVAVLCPVFVLGCRAVCSLFFPLCAVLRCAVLVRLRCRVRLFCAVSCAWCGGALLRVLPFPFVCCAVARCPLFCCVLLCCVDAFGVGVPVWRVAGCPAV